MSDALSVTHISTRDRLGSGAGVAPRAGMRGRGGGNGGASCGCVGEVLRRGEGESSGGEEGWWRVTILPAARFPPMNRGCHSSWLPLRTSYGNSSLVVPPGLEAGREGGEALLCLPPRQQAGPPGGPGTGQRRSGGRPRPAWLCVCCRHGLITAPSPASVGCDKSRGGATVSAVGSTLLCRTRELSLKLSLQ